VSIAHPPTDGFAVRIDNALTIAHQIEAGKVRRHDPGR
jgi:S1-C subfamily serine protease